MQIAARCLMRDAPAIDEWRLDQARLLCRALCHGSGKNTWTPASDAGGIMCGQHFNRIMLDQAQIASALFADLLQQAAHAGRMHFDADEIFVRHAGSDFGRGFAHAETDFQDRSARCGRMPGDIKRRLWRTAMQKLRTQRFDRAFLRGRQASCARDETANAVFGRVVKKRLVVSVVGCVIGHAECLGMWQRRALHGNIEAENTLDRCRNHAQASIDLPGTYCTVAIRPEPQFATF
jgi:hypothetical protein